jgi:hypothetical protein
MNARKYAWQMLHAEIRRRVNPADDKGLDLDPQLTNFALLYKRAREEGVSDLDIMIELAGFGAIAFLQRGPLPGQTLTACGPDGFTQTIDLGGLPRNDPLTVANRIEQSIMTGPDDDDDDEDDDGND